MKEAMAPKRIPLIGHTIQQMAHPLMNYWNAWSCHAQT